MKKLIVTIIAVLLFSSCSTAPVKDPSYNQSTYITSTTVEATRYLKPYATTTAPTATSTTTTTTGIEDYVESCEIVQYHELAHNTANYIDCDIAYLAKVLQVIYADSDDKCYLRLAVSTDFSINYKDTVIGVCYPIDNFSFCVDDFVAIFGKCKGKESYESVLGEKITLPLIDICYMSEVDSSMFVQTDENGNQYFIFDGLQITLSSEYEFTTVNNQFSENYGELVIAIPATITNISEETKYLYSGDVKLFGSAGTSLDSIHTLFDDGDEVFKDLRSGATQEGKFYLLYDGDGDYYLEFRDFDFTLEIKYPVTK